MDPDAYRQMAAAEERHWWFRGRRRIVRDVVAGLSLPRPARILDGGCGTGRNLLDLAAFGEVAGVEPDRGCAEAARARGIGEIREGGLEELPFDDGGFDLVTCLDVLEHLSDDRRGLRELRRVARPGAPLVVTAPAYPRLWSRHDELNHHVRRYTRRDLLAKAREAGWRPVRDGYFNTFWLAPAAAMRLAQRARRPPPDRGLDLELTPPTLDGLMELPLRAEAALVRRGVRLPAGLSILAVLRADGLAHHPCGDGAISATL